MDIAEVAISAPLGLQHPLVRRYWSRPHRLPINAAITMLVWTHLSLTLLIIATVLVSGWVWANMPRAIV
jgi:hypothetical protein